MDQQPLHMQGASNPFSYGMPPIMKGSSGNLFANNMVPSMPMSSRNPSNNFKPFQLEMLTSRYPTQPWEVLLHKPRHKCGASQCLEVDSFHNLTLSMGAMLEIALVLYHNPVICLETLLCREGKCSEVTHITVLVNQCSFNLTFLGPRSQAIMLMEGDLIHTIITWILATVVSAK
jgi:hypothetical protein